MCLLIGHLQIAFDTSTGMLWASAFVTYASKHSGTRNDVISGEATMWQEQYDTEGTCPLVFTRADILRGETKRDSLVNAEHAREARSSHTWSIMAWAPFAKSPKGASQMHSAFGSTVLRGTGA